MTTSEKTSLEVEFCIGNAVLGHYPDLACTLIFDETGDLCMVQTLGTIDSRRNQLVQIDRWDRDPISAAIWRAAVEEVRKREPSLLDVAERQAVAARNFAEAV